MTIDQIKEFHLNFIRDLADVDFENSPETVWRKLLRTELEDLGVVGDIANRITFSITVSLSGLGPDAGPHMEFLREHAKLAAPVFLKGWHAAYQNFGIEGAQEFVKRMSFSIT